MGCNSHLAIEYRAGYGWETWALDVAESRSYRMYSAMAGVRSYHDDGIIPVSQPKGFPENSDAADFLRDSMAEHSFTWLTPTEYSLALTRASGPVTHPGKEWIALKSVLDVLVNYFGEDNIRLLVGFDN